MMRCGLLFLSLSISFSFSLPGFASDAATRIERHAEFDAPSLVASFNHWKERFIHPVFCPVVLCHGSCGAYQDACVLSEGAILNKISSPQGCAGACK